MSLSKLSRIALAAGALVGLCMPTSRAQSAVTVYGILDAGVTRVSNVGGDSRVLLDTGVMQGSRLGFRGTEDLGGGLAATFVIEQGLLLDTGALGQGGLAFGRQAWVGLSDSKLGSLSLGRQYDFMLDSLVAFINPTQSAGGYANNPLDNDRMSGQRVNNSIKYRSAVMNGFSFGALVAPSESQGSVRGAGFSRSFGANYKRGAFNSGVAYTYMQGATLDIASLVGSTTPTVIGGTSSEAYGLGASYQFGDNIVLHAVVNQSKFTGVAAGTNAKFRNIEGGVAYLPTPQWRLGASLNTTKLRSNDYRQLNLTADYLLSKRTDVYAQVIHQRAEGDGATANIFILPGSSTDTQTALRVGLRHTF